MKRVDVYRKALERRIGMEVVPEYRFHPVRMWRFDYAIPSLKIAIEVDGAVWTGGRHTDPAGYIGDMTKLNTAASMGWLVLRFTTSNKMSTESMRLLEEAIAMRQGEPEPRKAVVFGEDVHCAVVGRVPRER